jgi:hypothetical protein
MLAMSANEEPAVKEMVVTATLTSDAAMNSTMGSLNPPPPSTATAVPPTLVEAPHLLTAPEASEAATALAISVGHEGGAFGHPASMPSGEPSPSSENLSDEAEDGPTTGLGMWKKHVWTQEEDNLLLQCVCWR